MREKRVNWKIMVKVLILSSINERETLNKSLALCQNFIIFVLCLAHINQRILGWLFLFSL